ncbi:glucose-6-phosphate dehydrogenase [Dioszegia hungarica]|uniref:Glucose-6-phosphate 1-dehydrogenase n=1 Tax=Dioszegia hungarica TaxID=4972 RepID=A0AA38HE96_9TREE|nr:glucose-6-phosphate dehydrogenase [Dioszegia hungarica]KAI9637406.1 glucose-6-phosphate dehydrogenase [Dioszegia hungarica]
MPGRVRSDSKRGSIPSMEASGNKLVDPTVIVVLGASGDLAKKKTFPAIFALFQQGLLPKDIKIVGYARTKMDEEEFYKRLTSGFDRNKKDPLLSKNFDEKLEEFKKASTYISGAYDKDDGFQELNKHLEELESNNGGKSNRVFYLALPPSVFADVAKGLKKNVYTKDGTNRLIVEKPFGKDTESSKDLISSIKEDWTEDETYRIDHYLGKEMIKNMLVLRFGNVFLDGTMNRNFISNVQITFKEPFGTDGRGGYFDEFGIIRDVCQNHLMQTLSVLAMERPVSFGPEDIRDEKVKVLRCIPPIDRKDVLLGQYTKGKDMDGKDQPGYLEDETVPKGSTCPTFAAMVLWINNPRWEGVPFIMKAGKALDESKVVVRIQYKDATPGIFTGIPRNELVMRIQPDEAVWLKMNSKLPGFATRAVPAELDLSYKQRFEDARIPQAYEALILDAFKGDHSNFVRDDELDVAWKIFTPILHWIDGKDSSDKPKPEEYEFGSRGPASIDEFTKRFGYQRDDEDYHWPTTKVDQQSNL